MLLTKTCPQDPRPRRFAGKPRRGAVALEFALTLPLLLVVVLGIIEIGRAMMVSQTLTNAARLGARRAILRGASNEEVSQVVTDFCAGALQVEATAISVQIAVAENASDLSQAQTGDRCLITVQVPFDRVAFAAPRYLAQQTLSGVCLMEHE